MEIKNLEDHCFFQYMPEANLPVYLRINVNQFNGDFLTLLNQMQFKEVVKSDNHKVIKALESTPHARVLNIKEATPAVAKQIGEAHDSDTYGLESVSKGRGYRIYRFKGEAMMIYSDRATEWEMGCFFDFGSIDQSQKYTMILNRYLTFALAPLGVIGFWGVPVDEGIVVMNARASKGEAVFVDIRERRVLAADGLEKIKGRFKVLRLDPILKNKNVRMTGPELLSFLSVNTSYLDIEGLNRSIRQMIQTISVMLEGVIYPAESFKPRTDLSLP